MAQSMTLAQGAATAVCRCLHYLRRCLRYVRRCSRLLGGLLGRLPLVYHYQRARYVNLDPAIRDLRGRGELEEEPAPTYAANFLCWRRSTLSLALWSIGVCIVLQIAATVGAHLGRPEPSGGLSGAISEMVGSEGFSQRADAIGSACLRGCNASALTDATERAVAAAAASLASGALTSPATGSAATAWNAASVGAGGPTFDSYLTAELTTGMTASIIARCQGTCLRMHELADECASAIEAALQSAGGAAGPALDPASLVTRLCNVSGGGGGGSSEPTPVALRYAAYQTAVGAVKVASRLASLAFAALANRAWRDYPTSRRFAIRSYVFFSAGPFLTCLLPWFAVLGFEDAIRLTHPAAEGSGVGLSELLRAKDSLAYRTRIAMNSGGGLVTVVLASVPSLLYGCKYWKLLFPQSSLWGLGIKYLPYAFASLCIWSLTLFNQMISDAWVAAFTLTLSVAYLPYRYFASDINSPAARASAAAAERQLVLSYRGYLATMVLAYTWLAVYFAIILVAFARVLGTVRSRLGTEGASAPKTSPSP